MVIIDSYGLTDTGKKRKHNEDNFIVNDDLKLYIVADGVGGHKAGEVASKVVIDTIYEQIKKIEKKIKKSNNLKTEDKTLSPLIDLLSGDYLLSSINLSNKKIYNMSQKNPACKGMGSTVSAVYFNELSFVAANVGDSPIYLIHDNNIDLISVTHTVKAEHAKMYPDDSKELNVSFSHMLTRGVGIGEKVESDICHLKFFKDDIIIIASDGLSDKISQKEILEIASKYKPAVACEKLILLANKYGGEDNITVIILHVKSVKNKSKFIRFLCKINNAVKKKVLKQCM